MAEGDLHLCFIYVLLAQEAKQGCQLNLLVFDPSCWDKFKLVNLVGSINLSSYFFQNIFLFLLS
jgi:hypothetical protein